MTDKTKGHHKRRDAMIGKAFGGKEYQIGHGPKREQLGSHPGRQIGIIPGGKFGHVGGPELKSIHFKKRGHK